MGRSFPHKASSQPLRKLTHTNAHKCTPFRMNHIHRPTKFQLSILINKKVGLSALRKGHYMALGRMNPRGISLYSISYQINNIHNKFQLSISINKKVGPSAQRKGRFAALRGVSPLICISLNFILYE